MKIRPAQLDDAQAVAEIQVAAWCAAYSDIVPARYLDALSVEEKAEDWHQCIQTGYPELLVAQQGSEVIGWLSFAASRDADAHPQQAEIWALYVAPLHWSAGAGRELWNHARGLMQAQKFTSCSLWVLAENSQAIGFYRAVGFVPDQLPSKPFKLGGREVWEARYSCVLPPHTNGSSLLKKNSSR